MFGLPVDREPATIHLSWAGLALCISIVLVWPVVVIFALPDWLGLNCIDAHGRRARAIRHLVCAASEGPAGWLYLVVLFGPFTMFAWRLRGKLRAARPADRRRPD